MPCGAEETAREREGRVGRRGGQGAFILHKPVRSRKVRLSAAVYMLLRKRRLPSCVKTGTENEIRTIMTVRISDE